ncbi:MAG: DUF2946 family protein [Burkholderiales bacterium]|nr:DUF2946 family protein [Burkholderiales bacterium]
MDDIVKAALKKWPNVPHCYGWLALDARGDWYMRDDRTQAAGPFPQVKGSRIQHDKLKEFINRNYESDEAGAWFFQNGPQRVYVELEAAPWVLGVERGVAGDASCFRVETHTGVLVNEVRGAWLDEHGRLFLDTNLGLGVVRSMDMDAAADAVSAGVWGEPQELAFADLPGRFGCGLSPRPPT